MFHNMSLRDIFLYTEKAEKWEKVQCLIIVTSSNRFHNTVIT